MDAAIESVFVEPGIEVVEGQLLVEFDQRDLLNEQNQIMTQIATTKIEANSLLQNDEAQEAFLLQSKLEMLAAELEIVEQQLSRTKLFAERAGVVLPSEIHKRIGQFVKLGEPLFEIADSNKWRLEIETPEREVRHVQVNQNCQFQSRARPDQISECAISFVSPASKTVDQKNVVLSHAEMASRPNWMKIGMEGYVKIDTGKQPVWWVYAHPLIDFVRLQLWM